MLTKSPNRDSVRVREDHRQGVEEAAVDLVVVDALAGELANEVAGMRAAVSPAGFGDQAQEVDEEVCTGATRGGTEVVARLAPDHGQVGGQPMLVSPPRTQPHFGALRWTMAS